MRPTTSEEARGLFAKLPSRPGVVWRTFPLETDVLPGMQVSIELRLVEPFTPHWLILSTPGFWILSLSRDRAREYLVYGDTRRIDGDLFLWSSWDELFAQGPSALDRVRMPIGPLAECATLRLVVEAKPQLITHVKKTRKFSGMLIGEELVQR